MTINLHMFDKTIKLILILLAIFTPIAIGSMEIWAFSLMELSILLVIILGMSQKIIWRSPPSLPHHKDLKIRNQILLISGIMLSVYLGLIFVQTIPLPPGLLKVLSPKTYDLLQSLAIKNSSGELITPGFRISLFPFATKIELFKWLTLAGFFVFLLSWEPQNRDWISTSLVIPIIFVGVFESLYGMFEFFSGHHHILYLDESHWVSAVTGTFINRNYFAGYLSMVIPLSIGFLFFRESLHGIKHMGWRHRLSLLDGKTLLIGFCVIVMILGLLLSASRMGITSLLASFTVMSLLFKDPKKRAKHSKAPVLILALAILWSVWIGLDAVISRFFTASEDFMSRWRIWVDTFKIIKDFPIFGSGLGTFTWVFPMYQTSHILGHRTHAENDYLQLTSEVGLLGIILATVLFLFLLFRAISGIRSLSPNNSQRYIALGAMVGILALMFHSIAERNIQVPSNAFLYTILWAMVLRVSIHSEFKK